MIGSSGNNNVMHSGGLGGNGGGLDRGMITEARKHTNYSPTNTPLQPISVAYSPVTTLIDGGVSLNSNNNNNNNSSRYE